jgi:acetyl esterase/lipase
MRRSLALVMSLCLGSLAWSADKPLVIDVWPAAAPGETGAIGAEKLVDGQPGQRQVKRLTNVSKPTLTVFRPASDKDTGAAVLICPGGGYNILAWDLEGEEVAGWLNSLGVTGIVLKYRVPRRPDQPKDKPPIGPLQDAQRAMSLVRSKASELKIDPKRLGILGFSAGGHLAAATSTNFDRRAYDAMDEIDKISCRPDFAVLIYPAYLIAKDKDALADDIRVTKETPPTFFAHASNDGVKSDNSLLMYLALKRAGVPSELHIYATGGHGFGLRPSQEPCSTWPTRCGDWMKAQGLLRAPADR